MAYKCQEFCEGQILKAENLNRIERGIADLDLSASIVCEATGESIAVANASSRALPGLTIYGKTTQNGTPTPDAPVSLESVGESVNVDVRGGNLLYSVERLTEKTVAGITFTPVYDSNGLLDYINVNGTCTATHWSDFDLLTVAGNVKADLPKGQTVMLHGGTSSVSLCLEGSGVVNDVGAGRTATLTGDQYWVYLRVWSGRTVNNEKVYPMLNFGGTALPYEPPKPRQTLTATAEGGLCGIGEVKDEIDFARGVRVRRVAQRVFDGTEDWLIYNVGQTNEHVYLRKTNSTYPQVPMCNMLRCAVAATANQSSDTVATVGQTTDITIYRPSYTFPEVTSAETWKAKLAELAAAGTPLTFQYALAEPVETPLSADELSAFASLYSNNPNTTVFNDANAGMRLAYVADTKTYIDQKLADISAAMLNA